MVEQENELLALERPFCGRGDVRRPAPVRKRPVAGRNVAGVGVRRLRRAASSRQNNRRQPGPGHADAPMLAPVSVASAKTSSRLTSPSMSGSRAPVASPMRRASSWVMSLGDLVRFRTSRGRPKPWHANRSRRTRRSGLGPSCPRGAAGVPADGPCAAGDGRGRDHHRLVSSNARERSNGVRLRRRRFTRLLSLCSAAHVLVAGQIEGVGSMPRRPGTAQRPPPDARGRFFETLRRDADLHCLEAALSSATGPAMLNRKVDQPDR